MKYKIGQVLYRTSADDETGKCEMDKYMVRTIRGGFVYAVAKFDGVTYGKRSSKKGDIGWLNPVDPIFRYRTVFGGKFSHLHTTKIKAWQALLSESKTYKYFDSDEVQNKAISTCKRILGRLRNGK